MLETTLGTICMCDIRKKIAAVLHSEKPITTAHLSEAYRLQRRMDCVGVISLIEEMGLDSILEIYGIEVSDLSIDKVI